MQDDKRILDVIFFIIMLNFIVLVLIFTLSDLTYAQSIPYLHEESIYEISKHTLPNQNANIAVGEGPAPLLAYQDKVFVANRDDDTVSVISTTNNTRIGNDIKVGKGPVAIGATEGKIFVANFRDDTVSVISTINNTRIGNDIKVGKGPTAIGAYQDKVFVANQNNGSVSVINATNNTRIGNDIKVGKGPTAIGLENIGFGENYFGLMFVANQDDGTVSVINATNNAKIGKDIKVGKRPTAIGAYQDSTGIKVFVANSGDGTVSVINATTNHDDGSVSVINATSNAKIGNDIKVGKEPTAIAVDYDNNQVSVTNSGDGTVSVISTINNTRIGNDIKVGKLPWDIEAAFGKVFVTNRGDNTISVINATNNTRIGNDIVVGKLPLNIGVDLGRKAVYVANNHDNTISVIDGYTNKVVAGIAFNVNPFNSGHIECDKDKIVVPTSQRFYLWSGSDCTAKPNQGFEFVSWQENLDDNATQLIKLAPPSPIWYPILSFLNLTNDKPEAKLNVSKFGSFTANFKSLPPAIPPEYLLAIFGLTVSIIIPSIFRWTNGWRQRRNLDVCIRNIDPENRKGLDRQGADRELIYSNKDEAEKEIRDLYIKGKISESHLKMLKDMIDSKFKA